MAQTASAEQAPPPETAKSADASSAAASAAPVTAAPHIDARQAAQVEALRRANAAVLGVRTKAIEDAASSKTLGPLRAGSGVVIGADGLVLTIGYLIMETESVELQLGNGGVVPARVVAYDQATGFGLVQAVVPLRIEPVPMGSAAALESDEALMITSGGDEGQIGLGQVVSRRDFAGYWEYQIDGALFTSPPRTDHSGAGLFNSNGELVGIGSLIVLDALGPGQPRLPGNMFVPVDLLKPILAEMRESGASSQSHRAWLGVNCVEQAGVVRVIRVNKESPAEEAGVRAGDRILRIDGAEVRDLTGFYKTLWSGTPAEREVVLDIQRDGETQSLKVPAQDRMKSLRRAQGI